MGYSRNKTWANQTWPAGRVRAAVQAVQDDLGKRTKLRVVLFSDLPDGTNQDEEGEIDLLDGVCVFTNWIDLRFDTPMNYGVVRIRVMGSSEEAEISISADKIDHVNRTFEILERVLKPVELPSRLDRAKQRYEESKARRDREWTQRADGPEPAPLPPPPTTRVLPQTPVPDTPALVAPQPVVIPQPVVVVVPHAVAPAESVESTDLQVAHVTGRYALAAAVIGAGGLAVLFGWFRGCARP